MMATAGIGIASRIERPPDYLLSERYEVLIRVLKAIGAYRDPKDLFAAMAKELRRVIQFDGIVVAQYDEPTDEIVWSACEVCSQTGPEPGPEIPADESITKWVYTQQKSLVIPALEREARFPRMTAFLRQKGFQCVCALPLTTVHRRIGSIAIASLAADAYSAEEVRFLSLVADQVAIAFDDALNFQASRAAQAALQRKNERLKLLLDVNNSIASKLELHDLMNEVSASIRRVMQCDAVSIALPDRDTGQLRVYALDFPDGKGIFQENILIPMGDDSPAARAYRTGEPAAVLVSASDCPWAAAEGVRSLCHVQLAGRDRALGLLSLARLAPEAFSDRD